MNLTATVYHDELVAKCKLGDSHGYELLYKQYSKSMFNTSFRIVNNRSDAEDVLQEAFSAAFQYLDDFDYSSTFGAWLKRIVINKSINVLRRRKLIVVDIEETTVHQAEETTLPDEENTRLKVEKVKNAVSLLPSGYRTVLSLYLFEGYEYREISELLHISEVTVRTQYHRARQKLLQLLQKGGL